MILDQPWQIELYRLGVLKHRLRLEISGMTSRQGSRTTLQEVNEVLMRNERIEAPMLRKYKALAALEVYIFDREQEAIAKGLM